MRNFSVGGAVGGLVACVLVAGWPGCTPDPNRPPLPPDPNRPAAVGQVDALARLDLDAPEHLAIAPGCEHHDWVARVPCFGGSPVYGSYDALSTAAAVEEVHQQLVARLLVEELRRAEAALPAPREVWVGALCFEDDPRQPRFLISFDPLRHLDLYAPGVDMQKRLTGLHAHKVRITGRPITPENHPEVVIFRVETVEDVK